ncbi:uncharacterized protein TNCV_3789881 [Trichonephila clavipes]|nr:uncharacterized protein TNCV_3789881 [Trichonephila clavipes]
MDDVLSGILKKGGMELQKVGFIANCRGEKERTFRCPGNQPSGGHLNQDCATTGVQKRYNKDGVLRVGGRLCNSDLNFESKFPVILPCNHKSTNLIVEYFHLKYFHLGPQALLYQRSKWKFEKDNARVGDLVLIKEDNLAVNKWLMGRLIEVFPGKDNRIRVVTIKTQHGVVKKTYL